MSILRVPIQSSPSTPGRPIFVQIFQAAVGKQNFKNNGHSIKSFIGQFFIIGIDIDCLEGRVYWSDVNGRVITSAAYNGSNSKVFLNSGNISYYIADLVSKNFVPIKAFNIFNILIKSPALFWDFSN
jgi:hypothetical protein